MRPFEGVAAVWLVFGGVVASACAPKAAPPRVFGERGAVDVLWTREDQALERAVKAHAKTETASYAFVRLRDGEALHRHDKSDMSMVLLSGRARVRIGASEVELSPGDVALIPRGVPHAVKNLSPEPITGFAVFSPPADPKDRIELE